jgi:hypothetical protein
MKRICDEIGVLEWGQWMDRTMGAEDSTRNVNDTNKQEKYMDH